MALAKFLFEQMFGTGDKTYAEYFWPRWRRSWQAQDYVAVRALRAELKRVFKTNRFRVALKKMKQDDAYQRWFYDYYGYWPTWDYEDRHRNRDDRLRRTGGTSLYRR